MTEEAQTAAAWRRARWLLILTVAWNLVEAGVAVTAGVIAESISLTGFGLDSLIETAAAALVLWRVRQEDDEVAERVEAQVSRFVGVTFFALAAWVSFEAARTLWLAEPPAESPVGIGLAVLSLLVMPGLAVAKLRTAERVGSRALRSEAKETLACAWLSLALLAGLGLNAAFGWWWADPAAALLMVPWLVKEGFEGFEDDDD